MIVCGSESIVPTILMRYPLKMNARIAKNVITEELLSHTIFCPVNISGKCFKSGVNANQDSGSFHSHSQSIN